MNPSQLLVPQGPPPTSTQAGADLARLTELLAERNRVDQAIAERERGRGVPGRPRSAARDRNHAHFHDRGL